MDFSQLFALLVTLALAIGLPIMAARDIVESSKRRERKRERDAERLEAAREKLREQRTEALKREKLRDRQQAYSDWQETFDRLDDSARHSTFD